MKLRYNNEKFLKSIDTKLKKIYNLIKKKENEEEEKWEKVQKIKILKALGL